MKAIQDIIYNSVLTNIHHFQYFSGIFDVKLVKVFEKYII